MNKGKGILGGLRARRGPSKVSFNYDEEHLWEDDMIERAEGLDVHTTRWQDPEVLMMLSLEEDFNYFAAQTKLEGFASNPQETYAEISREFLATFRFVHTKEKVTKRGKGTPSTFDVRFVMQGNRFIMPLEEFCKALKVPNTGFWDEIPSDSDADLQTFWRSISVDVPEDIHRGKLSHIQHPGLRYFALFLVRGFLARKNSTACTGPVIYLLKCAKEGRAPDYNLGVILARTLSYAVKHNLGKPLFAGAIATMVYEHIKDEIKFSNKGTKILETNLLDFSMLIKMQIVRKWPSGIFMYQFMVRRGRLESTVLPRVEYFDRSSDKWTVPELDEPSWDNTPAPPTYHTWGGTPAAPGYHTGEGSSSQLGNEGAPQEWAPWEQPGPYYDDGSSGWGPNPHYPGY
jgi:hypothetical protein